MRREGPQSCPGGRSKGVPQEMKELILGRKEPRRIGSISQIFEASNYHHSKTTELEREKWKKKRRMTSVQKN